MNYNKKLLKILANESFISPKTGEEYAKHLDEDLDALLSKGNLSKEDIDEIKGVVYPASWADDLMTVIGQLAWMLLHERKEHKRMLKEIVRDICSQIDTIKGYRPDYEYNHEGEDLFTYIKD